MIGYDQINEHIYVYTATHHSSQRFNITVTLNTAEHTNNKIDHILSCNNGLCVCSLRVCFICYG